MRAMESRTQSCRRANQRMSATQDKSLVQPPFEKYFCFSEMQIRCMFRAVLSRKRGVAQRHQRWVRDAVDALATQDGRRRKRTAKSCGPDAPTLASSRPRCFRIVACDGGKKARSPRRARRKPLKPFACGNAG